MANIYKTTTMLAAVKKMYPVRTFIRDRYFKTTPKDIFSTQRVIVEYKKGNRKLAPFVEKRSGGVTMEREGYYATDYEPAYIAPKRTLTLDNLEAKGFGESIYSDKTPEEKEKILLGEDLSELKEMNERRIEWMCCQLLIHGKVDMKHYSKEYGKGPYKLRTLCFYENTFDNEYAPKNMWDDDNYDLYQDFENIANIMNERGEKATDIILGSKAASLFVRNKTIQKMLDNRRMDFGFVKPEELPGGVAYYGRIEAAGVIFNIFSYTEKHENEDGNMESYIPANRIMALSPYIGRVLFGAISQVEAYDGAFHTYKGMMVPKYISDTTNNIRELILSSAPLPIPVNTESWLTGTVC